MQRSHLGTLLRKAGKGWLDGGALDRAAVLAYCAVFSIAPLMVIITFLVGLVHSGDTMDQVRTQFADFVSPQAADVIARGVVNAGVSRGRGIGYAAFAMMMLVVGASAFTYELQRAVDAMSGGPRSGETFLGALIRRLWTLVLGVGAGVFLQLSVVINNALLPGLRTAWPKLDIGVSFAVIVALYLVSYKLLPRTRVAWRDAAAGAVVAALLFGAGRWVVALYIVQASFNSIYGAAGSLMVLLSWLYYTSLVFLFGARFTRTCAEDGHTN